MSDEQIPEGPVQEGSRWRYHKPTADEVAAWFKTQPLDEGMSHEDYVSGVVVIPAKEKVEKQVERNGRLGTEETKEMTFTPYVRVDTRISYFRKLAELDGLVAVIEPVAVPKSDAQAFDNTNMPPGFWWHIMGGGSSAKRYLCCTMRVALYDKTEWHGTRTADGEIPLRPVREGVGTKQVYGEPEVNALARAETGAIGRALGVAGILVIGTGIATAEDMQELKEVPVAAAATLPEAGSPEMSSETLNERILALQHQLKDQAPEYWEKFSAWWKERQGEAGWVNLGAAPIEVRRGMLTRMTEMLAKAEAAPQQNSSLTEVTA
jgi:hypothetical protein